MWAPEGFYNFDEIKAMVAQASMDTFNASLKSEISHRPALHKLIKAEYELITESEWLEIEDRWTFIDACSSWAELAEAAGLVRKKEIAYLAFDYFCFWALSKFLESFKVHIFDPRHPVIRAPRDLMDTPTSIGLLQWSWPFEEGDVFREQDQLSSDIKEFEFCYLNKSTGQISACEEARQICRLLHPHEMLGCDAIIKALECVDGWFVCIKKNDMPKTTDEIKEWLWAQIEPDTLTLFSNIMGTGFEQSEERRAFQKRKLGRPKFTDQITENYKALYPNGHHVTADTWAQVTVKLEKEMGRMLKVDTVSRAVNAMVNSV